MSFGVDGQTARGQVERGDAGHYPNAIMRVEVGQLLASELAFLAGERVGVMRIESGSEVGQPQLLGSSLHGIVVHHVAAVLEAFVGIHGVQLVLVRGDAARFVGDVEELPPVRFIEKRPPKHAVVIRHDIAELLARRVHEDAWRGLVQEGDLEVRSGLVRGGQECA